MANFVLVAGTFHGGWYWDPVTPALLAAGHQVFAPTLSGLDPNLKSTAPINLDTHINDVLRNIEENCLEDVVLVGWSYGGMVITGVADRTSARVQKLVYLDGQLPASGQREWDLMPPEDQISTLSICLDGINIYPDEWMRNYEPRTQPHPIGTKLQPLKYDQAKFDEFEKIFVFAEKWFHVPDVVSPLRASFLKASKEPGWQVETWPFGHDLAREAPSQVVGLLLATTQSSG